ncbi:MAG TPA: hypothetical protein VEI01_08215 [Terriglobales bacterium]|nr:hypothetical protein [Terriglobales bacterium]
MAFPTAPGPGAILVSRLDLPALLVLLLSVAVGLLMVVIFRYTSDQKAIRVAKNRIKAHLLAVRLFQDQLPVVLRSYGRIVRSTGRYLQLAFKPLLLVALPLAILIGQLDRFLAWTPIPAGHVFLVKVRTTNTDAVDAVTLQLPPELSTTAVVHIPQDKEIVWRVVATRNGHYDLNLGTPDQIVSKNVIVASGWERLSPARLRGRFWKRWLVSGEPTLPADGQIESIEVDYPSRSIGFAGLDCNWIWLFLILSLVAGFLFKTVLGIEI